ncbi:hypothetical protein FACS189491_09170 [Spirochaetia bacterium]|nr:hypothetical protein FACS189491_09170 [Spirochaetia bacterium]
MTFFIEEKIINAVTSLLAGRVNELLEESEDRIPLIEFGYGAAPVIRLVAGELGEKDRVIRSEAYTAAIVFNVPGQDGERDCYAYADAVGRALGDDPTLGGAADRAVMTGKKYTCDPRELAITLRITIEGMAL